MSLDPDRVDDAQLGRLRSATIGTDIVVWLPAPTERRLRAWLNRCNEDAQRTGWSEEDLFDVEVDLPSALIAAADLGLEADEASYGVSYDELTGDPVDAGPMLWPNGHEVELAGDQVALRPRGEGWRVFVVIAVLAVVGATVVQVVAR
jgi:hypothetical protein